jgi:hypothetical protein
MEEFFMVTHTYEQAIHVVESLSPEDKKRLLEELTARTAGDTKPHREMHNIMDFRGLGKEIWEGIDAQEYVRQERASWNG